MAAEEAKKVEVEVETTTATKDIIAEEKAIVPVHDDSKAIVAVVKDAEGSRGSSERGQNEEQNNLCLVYPADKSSIHANKKNVPFCSSSDAYLTKIMSEKRTTLINAWEESEKARAENRAAKNLSFITSWEHAKEAEMEAELKKIEEQLEKKKAAYKEKLKNKLVMLHKSAEEKRAMAEAKRGEEIIMAEEMAAKYRAKGEAPTKLFGLLKA